MVDSFTQISQLSDLQPVVWINPPPFPSLLSLFSSPNRPPPHSSPTPRYHHSPNFFVVSQATLLPLPHRHLPSPPTLINRRWLPPRAFSTTAGSTLATLLPHPPIVTIVGLLSSIVTSCYHIPRYRHRGCHPPT